MQEEESLRHCQTTQDTSQTSAKHTHTLRHLPDNPKSINIGAVNGKNLLPLLGRAIKTVVEYNDIFCLQLLFHKYSLVNIQDQSDTIQKPFKHPPDKIQSP